MSSSHSNKVAEEQYLAAHAWANADHPAHSQSQQRQSSSQQPRSGSPLSGATTQRRKEPIESHNKSPTSGTSTKAVLNANSLPPLDGGGSTTGVSTAGGSIARGSVGISQYRASGNPGTKILRTANSTFDIFTSSRSSFYPSSIRGV